MSKKLTFDDCVSKKLVSIRKNRFQRFKRKTKRINKFYPGKGLIKKLDFILPERDRNGDFDRLNRPPRLLVPFECQVDSEVQEN